MSASLDDHLSARIYGAAGCEYVLLREPYHREGVGVLVVESEPGLISWPERFSAEATAATVERVHVL